MSPCYEPRHVVDFLPLNRGTWKSVLLSRLARHSVMCKPRLFARWAALRQGCLPIATSLRVNGRSPPEAALRKPLRAGGEEARMYARTKAEGDAGEGIASVCDRVRPLC